MKLVQKNHAFLLYYLTKNCWNFEWQGDYGIKRKNEAIHDRLLGPNQNGGKGYELPAIFNNPLSDD